MQKSPQASTFQRTGAGGAGTELLTSSLESLNGLKALIEQQEINFKDSSQAQKRAEDELAKLGKEHDKVQKDLKSKDALHIVLRCERDVAVNNLEITKAEVQRLQTTIDVLEKLLEKFQTSLGSGSKYSELLQKSNTMDASADSNRVLLEEKDSLKMKADEAMARQKSLEKQNHLLQEMNKNIFNRYKILLVDKKSIETEKELFKKQARAKQKHFVELQQEMSEKEKLVQSKNQEITRIKQTVQHLKNSQSTLIKEKSQVNTQLSSVRDLYHRSSTNLAASNTKRSKLTHQLNEMRQSEESLKKEVETIRNNFTENEKKLKESQHNLLEQLKKNEGLEKQTVQLRKIAKKRMRTLKKQLDENTKVLESLIKFEDGEEFKMTQRQIELHKQTPGTSKPPTSGATSDKISKAPLTNIKAMAAPVAAAVASPLLQVSARQVVATSIPLETQSDGIVSSSVTLPQATVTSFQTVSAFAQLATSTSSMATTTLMSTVSPTTAATTTAAAASQQQISTTSHSGKQAPCFSQASSSSSIAAAGQSSGESGTKRPFDKGPRVSQAEDLISQAKKQMRTR